MSYSAEISRSAPTAFLFLIDQSGSMSDKLPNGKSKASQVADVLNRTLATLITRCTKAEGTRDYFEIAVIGYGLDSAKNCLPSTLGPDFFHPISKIEAAPLRVEERSKKMDDGAGGVIDRAVKFPVWFEATADGGTPMRAAITQAATELADWCDRHPACYPPTVLHITDGESTDGDPLSLAEQLCQLSTDDGSVILFNLHVSSTGGEAIQFPSSDVMLTDRFAKLLFQMSSVLPSHLAALAVDKGFHVSSESRGFMFNADAVEIVEFFDIGTRAAQLR